MGTRNSTMVKLDGQIKVAQYGQWDGYPTGQGETIQKFLQNVDLEDFKKKIKALKVWTDKEVDDVINGSPQYLIGADTSWANKYPELSRDTAAEILQLIAEGKVTKVHLEPDFKNDDIWCEYWYEIDLDREIVTMNGKGYTFKEWTQDGFMDKLEEAESEDE